MSIWMLNTNLQKHYIYKRLCFSSCFSGHAHLFYCQIIYYTHYTLGKLGTVKFTFNFIVHK